MTICSVNCFETLPPGGIVALLVSRRVDAYQCSKMIYAQLWIIGGIEFRHALFEWRFEQSGGTTESSKVITHDKGNVLERAIRREIEASIDANSPKALQFCDCHGRFDGTFTKVSEHIHIG